MLVAGCRVARRGLPFHLLSQQHFGVSAVRSLAIVFMVQTRRATRLAAEEHVGEGVQGRSVDVKPPLQQPKPLARKREQPASESRRPTKRARKEEEPEESKPKPSVTAIQPTGETKIETETDDIETKRPRKSRSKKDVSPPKPSDFPPRVTSLWKVGAHVSAAGGVENSIVNAARVRANAFALFVKSQRKWSSPPLTDDSVTSFKARMIEFGYAPKYILPHGSYLINLANPDSAKREKSYECFLDDIQRCERLGLTLYNFHPGSTVGNATKDESIALIAQCINRAHKETSSVTIVIENMSGAKNIIGSQFTELRDIIEQVEDKSRVGVCLDTCHLFAAGYDISTKEGWDETMNTFDDQVGLSYLCGMHLNDSKTPLNSKKDRHENIGLGTLQLSSFANILSDPRVKDIPLILETPTFEAVEVWETEIDVLNKLLQIGKSEDSKEGEEEGGDCDGGNKQAGKETMLNELVGDIRSVIREYRDGKGNVGKKKTATATGKGKGKAMSTSASGKRKKVNDEEEEDSEDGGSCGDDSE